MLISPTRRALDHYKRESLSDAAVLGVCWKTPRVSGSLGDLGGGEREGALSGLAGGGVVLLNVRVAALRCCVIQS